MSPTIVLVHGGFVDGPGWRGVYDVLRGDGLDVRIVQNATRSHADDDSTTRQVLDTVDGPVVLVGHSYGGAVITDAGTHDKVAALVYSTAFAPDQGESVNTLLGTFPAEGPQPPILPPVNGYLFLDRAKFHDSFAAELTAAAAFLADARVPEVWTRSAARSAGPPDGSSRAGTCTSPRPDDPTRRPGVHGRAHRRHPGHHAGQPRDLRIAAQDPSPT